VQGKCNIGRNAGWEFLVLIMANDVIIEALPQSIELLLNQLGPEPLNKFTVSASDVSA
jgi:hypothetical protein